MCVLCVLMWKGVKVDNPYTDKAQTEKLLTFIEEGGCAQTGNREKKASFFLKKKKSHRRMKPSCSGLRVQMSLRQTDAPSYSSLCKIIQHTEIQTCHPVAPADSEAP